jgi:hypothetical protein
LPKSSPHHLAERAHRTFFEHTGDVQLASAPLFGLVTVEDLYDREQAISGGQAVAAALLGAQ